MVQVLSDTKCISELKMANGFYQGNNKLMSITQLFILASITIALNFIWNYTFNTNHVKTTPFPEIQNAEIINKTVKPSNKIIKYFFLVIAIFPLLGGIWTINYWFNDFNTAKDSIYWKEFSGHMIEKSIVQCSNAGTTGHQLAGRTYMPSVKYEFVYDNKNIIWHKINFLNTPCSGDISKSQNVLDTLPNENEKIIVYFSADKKQAVLITGTNNMSYFGVLGGIFFYLIGLIGIKLIYI